MATTDTLRAVIDAGRVAQRLDELSTARVIGKIAEQIHQAHQRAGTGKAVGPITPAGIVIDAAGITKLGLAEPTAFAYCAPEQAHGEDGDRRSDVFSLGVIMWEALTHRPLFEAGSDAATKKAVAERVVVSPLELNANIPAELGSICLKALARNPADRYQSAKVMAAEIEAVLEQAGYGDNNDKIVAYMRTLVGTAARRSPVSSSPPHLPSIPRAVPRPSSTARPVAQAPATAPARAPQPDSPSSSSGTAPGFAAAASAVTQAAPASSPTLLGTPPGPSAVPTPVPAPLPSTPPAHPAPAAAPATSRAPAAHTPAPRPPESAAPIPTPRSPEPATPHPAAAVSLPPASGGEPELLDGWRWRTGAQPVYQEDDAIDEMPRARSPLPYIIGGGVVVAGVILTIMLAFGSHAKPVQKQTPAVGSNVDPHSVNAPRDATLDDSSPSSPGSAVASPGSGSAAAAVVPADASPRDASPADAGGSDAKPPVDAPNPIGNRHDSADKPSQDKPSQRDQPTKREDKVEPKPAAKSPTKPTKPDVNTKSNAELEYRQGLQLFMRGDSSGAAKALRGSLAANPNYAPAWRALGLVFEKVGDTDQARTAFKRYLQLAPNASDAQQIRNRLEKLGL